MRRRAEGEPQRYRRGLRDDFCGLRPWKPRGTAAAAHLTEGRVAGHWQRYIIIAMVLLLLGTIRILTAVRRVHKSMWEKPPTQAWEVARTVVAQPPIAAKWFGRVFRSCVRLCGGSCAVRVTCVLYKSMWERYQKPATRGSLSLHLIRGRNYRYVPLARVGASGGARAFR